MLDHIVIPCLGPAVVVRAAPLQPKVRACHSLSSKCDPESARSLLTATLRGHRLRRGTSSSIPNSPALTRDSPDESQTGINVRVFPALWQDRRGADRNQRLG